MPIAVSGTWKGLPHAEQATGMNIGDNPEVLGQSMILLSGYSTMPQAPAAFRRGMMWRTVSSSMIVLSAIHAGSASGDSVGVLKGRQDAEHPLDVHLPHVHHQPDLPLGGHRALEHEDEIVHLLALPLVGAAAGLAMNRVVLVRRSQTMRRLFARRLEPVSVTSTMASASLGGFTSVAPQLNSTCAVTPWVASQLRVMFTTSVAMRLPWRSFGSFIGRVVRDGEHPPHRLAADLAEDQLRELGHRAEASFSTIQS